MTSDHDVAAFDVPANDLSPHGNKSWNLAKTLRWGSKRKIRSASEQRSCSASPKARTATDVPAATEDPKYEVSAEPPPNVTNPNPGKSAAKKKFFGLKLLGTNQKPLKRAIGGGSKANMDTVHWELTNAAESGHDRPSIVLSNKSNPIQPSTIEGSLPVARTPSKRVGLLTMSSKRNQKVPRTALERQKEWVVEYYKNHSEIITLENCSIAQNLQIRACSGANVQAKGKLNNVVIESCSNCNIVLDGVISSVELVHCEKVKLQVLGSCPSVNLDNCNGFTMFVGQDGREVVITSSRSCDMNVNIPNSEAADEWLELPIPQQFVHTINASNKVQSRVSDLYH